jgi:hypothetical protein
MKYFAEISGMNRHSIGTANYRGRRNSKGYKDLERETINKAKKYTYPAFIELDEGGLEAVSQDPLSNVYFSINTLEAAISGLDNQFIQIFSPGISSSREILLAMEDILNYFIHLQKTDFADIIKDDNTLTNTIESFCAWYKTYSKYTSPVDLVSAVKKILYQPRHCDSMVDLCCWLNKVEKLGIEHYPFMTSPEEINWKVLTIYIDDDANKVFIPHKPLTDKDYRVRRVAKSVNLSTITKDLITKNLLTENKTGIDGWIIPFDFFEERVKLWSERLKEN